MRRATVIAPLLALGACLPLTFSHEAVIDFDRYRSVAVHVEYRAGCELAAGSAGGRSSYLQGELKRESGFEQGFLLAGTTPDVDAELRVTLCGRRDVDFEEERDEWDVDAHFDLVDPAEGRRVLESGDVTATGETSEEAIEDALDEVAHHFLPSYRI